MVNYIEYRTLKEFYTISEACELLEMGKPDLQTKCEQYGILPVRNEKGVYGFVKYDFCNLHNKLYFEDRKEKKDDDPWA